MSFINRPDERRREAARLARANQAKPFVETESDHDVQGNNAFIRVSVPDGQQDDISRKVTHILGPYFSVLRGPSVNGLNTSQISTVSSVESAAESELGSFGVGDKECLSSSRQGVHESGGPKVIHLGSSSPINRSSAAASSDGEGCMNVPVTKSPKYFSSSTSSSKPRKPPLSSTIGSQLPSSVSSSMSSSSPTAIINNSTVHPGSNKSKEIKKTPILPLSVKTEDGNATLASPKNEINCLLKQTSPVLQISSKLRPVPKQPHPSSLSPKDQKPISNKNGILVNSRTSDKYNNVGKVDDSENERLSPSTVSLPLNSTSSRASTTTAESSHPRISPLKSSKAELDPSKEELEPWSRSYSRSYSRAKKVHLHNGVRLQQHSTGSIDASSSKDDSAGKVRLKLKMPDETKIATSRSELNEILKEMADLHAPLTAIQTPERIEGFSFSTADAARLSVSSSGFAEDEEERSEVKKELTERQGTPSKQDDHLRRGQPSPARRLCLYQSEYHVKEEENLVEKCDNKQMDSVPELFNDSVGGSKDSGLGSTGDSDVNSILRHDLDLSEDSDAEPVVEESSCQSNRGKVMSPSLGAPIRRILSPVSPNSNSSESSGEEDDDDDKKGGKEGSNEKEEEVDASHRRLSSSASSSDTSSGSEVSSDDDDDDDDGMKNGKDEREADGKRTVGVSETTDTLRAGPPTSANNYSASVQEESQTGMKWCLTHFIKDLKKSSPANDAPVKPESSGSPSVQQKGDQAFKSSDHSRTLGAVGHCDTMPFECQKVSNGFSDSSDEEESVGSCSSSVIKKEMTETPVKKVSSVCKRGGYKSRFSDASEKASSQAASSVTIKNELSIKSSSSPCNSKHERGNSKKVDTAVSPKKDKFCDPQSCLHPSEKVCSESAATEEKNWGQPVPDVDSSRRPGIMEVNSKHLNGNSIEAGDTDSQFVTSRGKNAPVYNIKHHKRKSVNNNQQPVITSSSLSDSDSSTRITATISPAAAATSSTKKPARYCANGAEINSKSLKSSELSASKRVPSDPSSEPYLPFQSSSPAQSPPHASSCKQESVTTVSQNSDASSQPRLTVKIRHSCLSRNVLDWLKDKKERRKQGKKSLKTSVSSADSEEHSKTKLVKEVEVSQNVHSKSQLCSSSKDFHAVCSGEVNTKTLNTSHIADGSSRTSSSLSSDHSTHSHSSNPSKQKLHDLNTGSCIDDDAMLKPVCKKPKHAKSSLKDTTLSSSSSSSLEEAPSLGSSKKAISNDITTISCMDNSATQSQLSEKTRRTKVPDTSTTLSSSSSSSLEQAPSFGSSKKPDSNDLPAASCNSTKLSPVYKKPKHDRYFKKCTKISSSSSSSVEEATSNGSSKKSPHNDLPTSSPLASSQCAVNGLLPECVQVQNKRSGVKEANKINIADSKQTDSASKSDHLKSSKRKLDTVEAVMPKKPKSDGTRQESNTVSNITAAKTSENSANAATKGNLKKSQHSVSGKDDDNSSKNIAKTIDHKTNGPEGVGYRRHDQGKVKGDVIKPSAPPAALAGFPPPCPVETILRPTKHYLDRATEHKHFADSQKDKLAKYEPYLRSVMCFFLAGYTMEVANKKDTSGKMYKDTSNLLQYVISLRANSGSNPESSDKERKLMVLLIRLQAYLNHRLYRLRKNEVLTLKRVINAEQVKLQSSSVVTTSANATAASRPQAPSPYQTTWNRNSTGTPSPTSPTPSPAGSVSSQGSCELGKIHNGNLSSTSTPMTSPSPVNNQQHLHSLSQRYFQLTGPLVKSLDLWDQADSESKSCADFFTVLDNACGQLTFHSDPPVVIRYMKHALHLLSLKH